MRDPPPGGESSGTRIRRAGPRRRAASPSSRPRRREALGPGRLGCGLPPLWQKCDRPRPNLNPDGVSPTVIAGSFSIDGRHDSTQVQHACDLVVRDLPP
jgi:hypothetical protein